MGPIQHGPHPEPRPKKGRRNAPLFAITIILEWPLSRNDHFQRRSGDVHQILELRRGGFLIDLLDCRELAGQSLKRRLIHLPLGI